MARTILSIPELYTDGVDDLGVVREVRWHARIVFQGEDPVGEWHYFGMSPGPEHPDAIVHAATHFPAAFDLLTEADASLLYDMALLAERQALEA